MNSNRKSMAFLLVTVLLLGSGVAMMASVDDAYCATHTWNANYQYEIPYSIDIDEGDNFTLTVQIHNNFYDDENYTVWFVVRSDSAIPPFVTVSGNNPNSPTVLKITGTNCTPGNYTMKLGYCDDNMYYPNPNSTRNLSINVSPNLLDMPYTPPSGNAVANKNWTYSPTPIPGTTITVTGANWLSVSGGTIYGVPPAAGDYVITVKMSKANYEDRTETFTLKVVSELVVLNSPSTGAIFAV